MIASNIEKFLIQISAYSVSEVVSFTITAIFFIALICNKLGKGNNFVAYTPTLLTSLGIFGTFVGIVIGLLAFDSSNIDGSIDGLLAGLKTAFITSLLGIILSIVFKVIQTSGLLSTKNKNNKIDTASPENILNAINNQNNSIEKLIVAIGGDSDGSILSQMKLLRGDLNDQQKLMFSIVKESSETQKNIDSKLSEQHTEFKQFTEKLWIKLQDFADMLSKSATETVIEALKQVITDFNNNLTEQFGDNFKQLNEAVQKLVTWQDNYKTQLEKMIKQYQQGVTAITETEASVAKISNESKIIPETMNNLQSVMEVNQHQLSELEKHLEAFKDIRDRAVEAVPEIRKQVDETVKTIADSVESASKHYEVLLTESDGYIQNHINTSNEVLDKFITNTNQGVEIIGSKMSECAEDFTNKVNRTNESLQTSSDHVASQTEVIKDHLKDTVSDLNNHVRTMINDLVEESKSMSATLQNANFELGKDTKSVRDTVVQSIDGMQKQLEESLENLLDYQTQHMNKVFNNLDSGLREQVGKTGEAVEKQLSTIDQSMQQEINRVMNQMGQALGQISNQFVQDYSKLVNQMNSIVKSAAV